MKKFLVVLLISQSIIFISGVFSLKTAKANMGENVCRKTCDWQSASSFVYTGTCMRDAPGPDVTEGPIGVCAGGGPGCNKAYCRTDYGSTCWVTGSNSPGCDGGGLQ